MLVPCPPEPVTPDLEAHSKAPHSGLRETKGTRAGAGDQPGAHQWVKVS